MTFRTVGPGEPEFDPTAISQRYGPLVIGALILGGIIGLFVLLAWLRQIYTDFLWFGSVGYLQVFKTSLFTKIWLFFAGALVFAILASVNLALVFRFSRGAQFQPIPPVALDLLRKLVLAGVVAVVFIASMAFGAAAANRWETFLAYFNTTPFNAPDPQFGLDIGFFVFNLPVYRFIQGWLLGAIIVIMLMSLALYLALYSIRGAALRLTPAIHRHFSVLGALLLFDFFISYWLGIYELNFSNRGAVFGATYTDVHARIPAMRLLMAVVLAGGILLLINTLVIRGVRLIPGIIGLWFGAVVLIGSLYPSAVQRFQVIPSELARERPYIQKNITATREAFGLSRIEGRDYPIEQQNILTETVTRNPETITNIRLWDHRPFKDVLNQIQFIRLYYNFADVDVDRYTLNGRYRQVVLGARELNPEQLPAEAKSWVNQRLQFTHGQGVAMAPVTEFTAEGRPEFLIKDVPPKGVFQITRPEVYYGELTRHYVIVNSKLPEFDYPTEADIPVYTSYQGKGGVRLSSFLRRLAYAWQFRDINILISGEITSESRIQYRRYIQEGVHTVVPFLRLDKDPYIVVADGRLFWIQDAYTVTNRYPYSEPAEGGFNYIRNSVKVVIDAYDGTQTYYVFEPQDPLIQTYQKIFPGLFRPLSEMSQALREHTRFPESLFRIQAEKYLKYHMQDATVFYNKEDQWSIPNEVVYGASEPMQPYYLIMRLPGETKEEFVLLLPFTPANRPNMVAWLAARNDGENYGKLLAYFFPKDKQLDGPDQVEARISQDFEIKQQFALLCSGEAQCIRGNLLVIPIEGAILYAEPLYLQAANLRYPELKRVILVDSTTVVMEPTLDTALAALTKTKPSVVGTSAPTQATGATQSQPAQAQQIERLEQALKALKEGLRQLEDALKTLR